MAHCSVLYSRYQFTKITSSVICTDCVKKTPPIQFYFDATIQVHLQSDFIEIKLGELCKCISPPYHFIVRDKSVPDLGKSGQIQIELAYYVNGAAFFVTISA